MLHNMNNYRPYSKRKMQYNQSMSVSDLLTGLPSKTMFLGYGDNAIYSTVEKIIKIVHESARTPYVRKWAERILNMYNIAAHDKWGEAKAIQMFVRDYVRYTRDPMGLEYLQSPLHLLKLLDIGETPHADCDDKSMLVLSLMKSIGFEVAVKVTGYSNSNGKFKHIYGLVKIKQLWYPVETVKEGKPLGWEAPNITRTLTKKIK